MKITIKYNNYADNGLGARTKVANIESVEDMLKLILWLSVKVNNATNAQEHIIHELTIDGVKFDTCKFSNPDSWTSEIKKIAKNY